MLFDSQRISIAKSETPQPSEVERLLLGEEPPSSTEDDSDADAVEASDSAA